MQKYITIGWVFYIYFFLIFGQKNDPKPLVHISMRKNQNHFVKSSKIKAKIRKRIETNFSQLHGQFSWTVNHAKSFLGLATRLLSKITAFTMIQYLNVFIFNKPINKINRRPRKNLNYNNPKNLFYKFVNQKVAFTS